jgi:hypothetical protein
MPTAFISYSWDSEEHRDWVRHLAVRLQHDGVDITLDQWHLVPGDRLPHFMEQAVRASDFVLIVCTRRYKKRSDQRSGGVGYEGDIMSAEVLTTGNQRKFIPILRETPWVASAPSWLSGKYYIDLSNTPFLDAQYQDLLTTLLGKRPSPPIVSRPAAPPAVVSGPADSREQEPGAAPSHFEPIAITGIVVDQVGAPRGNGSRGSALYDVPFRLSRHPPDEWAMLFVEAWNHPREFSYMHRPGIASIVGDTVHLDGTTIDEIERHHRKTLLLAASEANTRFAELLQRRYREEESQGLRDERHRHNVEQAAKRIKFDR